MSTFKTRIDVTAVDNFLVGKYGDKASKAVFIKGGEISQAFSFDVEGESFIIRMNKHNSNGFDKDMYAHKNFSSSTLHIPEIIEIGKTNEGLFYAISQRAAGGTVLSLSGGKIETILPQFLDVLDEIHSKDISSKQGYGIIDKDGKGSVSSWRDEVLAVGRQDWQKRFETTFMEKELYEKLYSKLEELAVVCPEQRSLVHGDYSFDNVLSDGKEVTGVIDWAQSMYGDFLYDIAWISFWPSSKEHAGAFKRHYEEKGALPLNYRERILCYQIWIALNSLGFYAYSDQKDKYDWAKGRILGLL